MISSYYSLIWESVDVTELPSTISRGVQGLSIWNRLSSWMGSPSCSSIYSRIISSVTVPELTAKYPRAHKCLPQNCLFKCANSWSITRELIPLSHCTIWLMFWFGRYETNTCTWSLATFHDSMWTSCSMAICRSRSRTRMATGPTSTFFRYLGIQTECTFKSNFVCAPCL